MVKSFSILIKFKVHVLSEQKKKKKKSRRKNPGWMCRTDEWGGGDSFPGGEDSCDQRREVEKAFGHDLKFRVK